MSQSPESPVMDLESPFPVDGTILTLPMAIDLRCSEGWTSRRKATVRKPIGNIKCDRLTLHRYFLEKYLMCQETWD